MYSKTFAYLLWFFSGCGWLGLHRFYLRKPATAVLWMCTGGLFGIGSIYDLITLGSQVDNANMRAALFNGSAASAAAAYGAGFAGGTRFVRDGSSRIVRDKETAERAVLRLAKANNGIITAADLSLETGITMDEAKKKLEELAAKGHIDMRVKSNGALVFTVNEFLQDESGFEA
ncbi:MAG: TM2 domain-containing protein [Spirochaetaceae bacterium]|nr:TM2 domain-containing protein [Spirochaetaceae bacterium]